VFVKTHLQHVHDMTIKIKSHFLEPILHLRVFLFQRLNLKPFLKKFGSVDRAVAFTNIFHYFFRRLLGAPSLSTNSKKEILQRGVDNISQKLPLP